MLVLCYYELPERKQTLFLPNLTFNVINSDLVFKEANNYRTRENIAEIMSYLYNPGHCWTTEGNVYLWCYKN